MFLSTSIDGQLKAWPLQLILENNPNLRPVMRERKVSKQEQLRKISARLLPEKKEKEKEMPKGEISCSFTETYQESCLAVAGRVDGTVSVWSLTLILTMIDADYFVVCLLSCSWYSPSSLLPPTNRTLCTIWITFLATTTRRREGGGFPVWLCPRTSTLWHRLTTPPCNFGCTTPTRRTKPPLASKVFNWTQMSPLWHSLLKKNSSWWELRKTP